MNTRRIAKVYAFVTLVVLGFALSMLVFTVVLNARVGFVDAGLLVSAIVFCVLALSILARVDARPTTMRERLGARDDSG